MTLLRILAIIIAIVTLLMLLPLVMALVMGESFMIRPFLIPPATGLALAILAVLFIPKEKISLRSRDGFLLVFLTWILSSLLGSIPYYLSPLNLSICDSIFESACGFATTGATTFQDVEALPRSLLFWRSLSHWTGGIGIILLTVALMPLKKIVQKYVLHRIILQL